MAYEASEISTAIALQLNNTDLNKIKDQGQLQKLIKDGIKSAKAGRKIQFGDSTTSNGFIKKLDPNSPKAIADMAVGVSAAIGIRNYIKKSSGPVTVYMTGNTWPKDVEDFKVSAFGFTDYNSSDIIVSSDKKMFYGVSLKKKKTVKAGDPTLINKAFSSVFDGKEYDKLKENLTKMRIKFFADTIREAIKEEIILKKDVVNYSKLSDLELFESKDIDKTQFGKKKYIDTKGYAKAPKDGYLYGNTNDIKSMRYFVNRKLSDPKSKLWALYKEVVKDYAEELGDALINIILKTKLYDKLNAKKLKGKNFNFSLITGIADITNKGVVKISPAKVYPLKTTLCGLKRIEKINKNDPYKLVVDTVQSAKSKAAKIFFNLIKGKSKILDIRVRYKGTFTAKPQFQGGMTSEFKLLVDKECGSS
tara:strand:+ start:72 stop:1328 length:1257 start_codon:yes stop_codon:yes gene_type:complete